MESVKKITQTLRNKIEWDLPFMNTSLGERFFASSLEHSFPPYPSVSSSSLISIICGIFFSLPGDDFKVKVITFIAFSPFLQFFSDFSLVQFTDFFPSFQNIFRLPLEWGHNVSKPYVRDCHYSFDAFDGIGTFSQKINQLSFYVFLD